MTNAEISLVVSRIISGKTRLRIGGVLFSYKTPSLDSIYLAENIYKECEESGAWTNALTDDQLQEFLEKHEIFTKKDSDRLAIIEKNIEDQKVGLFEYAVRPYERQKIQKALELAKAEQLRLFNLRHSYDHFSISGIATQSKTYFLIGSALYYNDGTKYWQNPEEDWNNSDSVVLKATQILSSLRVDEKGIREIVRKEPWNSIWTTSKKSGQGVFGLPSVDLSADQKSLLIWSSVYDSVREHPHCPADDIVNDDDMLDGWMILQRREAEKNKAAKLGDELIGNEKIKNSGEVFIPAKSKEDVDKIIGLNSDEGRSTANQRIKIAAEAGKTGVHEQHLPDVKRKAQMELAKRLMDSRKG